MDMDGVLVHEEHAIPGAQEFLTALREAGTPFLVLTNNSIYTRRDLSARLRTSGLEVPEDSIWTSGLTTALYTSGYTMTDRDPDYVVLGETRTYSFDRITQAIRLISNGARFTA